jgi:hypothetical protein
VILEVFRPNRHALGMWRAALLLKAAHTCSSESSRYPIVFVAVYRRHNVKTLISLLRQCPAGADIRLWSLDEPVTELSSLTVGIGKGTKFELVNKLLSIKPLDDKSWIVVADDDVLFSRGSIDEMIGYCVAGSLDIAQPSHHPASYYNHPFTLCRPWARARLTGFVEVGPFFVLGPEHRDQFVPFDERGMGWGIEFQWNDRIRYGARLGIIDVCRIVHTVPAGHTYSVEEEANYLRERLGRSGLSSVDEAKICQATWYRWERAPSRRFLGR